MHPTMTIDTGNTGFMILCSSLVMLMTPGLAFFYGGLVGRKNVLAIMMQSFVSMGWTTVLWFAFGYSLCFSGDVGGIIGNLDMAFLHGVDLMSPSPLNPSIPMLVFIAYQMMFAIITPALITGAFANRVTFKAYFLFLTAWLIFVYFPFVHMVWGGGLLAQWGVLDFAGGIVVHNIAGMAALASVLYVGRRKSVDAGPHSIPLVALGTGLLWFGWYGFNAGSEFRVDGVTAQRIPEHRSRGKLRRYRVAVHGMDVLEKTEIFGIAYRRSCWTCDHHSGRRICFTDVRLRYRYCRRTRLLLGRDVEEQAQMGRCAGCLGRAWRGRRIGNRSSGSVGRRKLQSRRTHQWIASRQCIILR